ncbi:30S ribosomal protein S28e [archaeon]|jgi:small subunit ribosomal protein S28e|nr:30S ribosomal protein S28e [archaeon]MBT6182681.1 30S ribosomal protein S28e [archaeon]MBT6606457.1 30S ribosomal protein S28e [archaeon]MBT7251378.1 30S ribosomal protein S28e [archaeon]MBT7660745.1 30S ribosomal protein S28e [archaeon]
MAKDKKQEKPQQKKSGASKGSESLTSEGAVPAIVEAVLARTGTRGEIIQVRCKILQGKNRGKSMRRNVRGPIKERDVLMLRETEIEARRVFKKGARRSSN